MANLEDKFKKELKKPKYSQIKNLETVILDQKEEI